MGSSYRKSSIYCLEKLKSRKLLKTPEQSLNELLIRATMTWSIGGRDDQRVKRHPETARIAAISHGTTSTPGPPQNRRQVGRFTLYSHITHTHTAHSWSLQMSIQPLTGFGIHHCPVFSRTNQLRRPHNCSAIE